MESRKVNISKLVGRSYDQADCWDTAREFYMLVFQVELKLSLKKKSLELIHVPGSFSS